MSEPWAKLEIGGECNDSKYIMFTYGACDVITKVPIASWGVFNTDPKKCIQWHDRKDWQVRLVPGFQARDTWN